MQTDHFLFEVGTEELPAKGLSKLVNALCDNMAQNLIKAELKFSHIKTYAAPRRLAVLIQDLIAKQPDRKIERKGPALAAAFDTEGKATPALQGFLRSCNTTLDQTQQENDRIVYCYQETGKTIEELLPDIIRKAIANLPISKPMRWGNSTEHFLRPVHWIVLLYGETVISTNIFGIQTNRFTYGHRFHHPHAIELKHAADYASILKSSGFVIADSTERKNIICQQINDLMKNDCQAIIDAELLDEVAGLVEWPVALIAHFDNSFLNVPREALISAIQNHQKSFPIVDCHNQLLSQFITVSNINSTHPVEVIKGNERVMRARLADAKFFFETDCQQKLIARLEQLKHVTFQAKLGNLYEKSERIAKLAEFIAQKLSINTEYARRAGWLCKADLVTNMVGEFPELQGIIGYYYAKHDEENNEVTIAIRDHYFPQNALATANELTQYAAAIALADKLDTLAGIFGINQAPTSDKDPFALRRAAIGVLRILIEKQLPLNLVELITQAQNNYKYNLVNTDTQAQLHTFILERLPALYHDYNISHDMLVAVLAINNEIPLDFHHRLLALRDFCALPGASALVEANKRANNLLVKAGELVSFGDIDALTQVDSALFKDENEQKLYNSLVKLNKLLKENNNQTASAENYLYLLTQLSTLQTPIAAFFDSVMVMDENEKLRHNRLSLLAALRSLFLHIADISLVQFKS